MVGCRLVLGLSRMAFLKINVLVRDRAKKVNQGGAGWHPLLTLAAFYILGSVSFVRTPVKAAVSCLLEGKGSRRSFFWPSHDLLPRFNKAGL